MKHFLVSSRVWRLLEGVNAPGVHRQIIPILTMILLLGGISFMVSNQPLVMGQATYDVLGPTQTTVTLTADADATVKSWLPGTNFGSEDVLEVSYSNIDEPLETVTLLHFDLASALPANAIIDSAVLELFLVDGVGDDPVDIAAYFVTSAWVESSVTWNSFPTAEPMGIISPVDASPGSYKSWGVTSFAQAWHSGPNDGLYLRGPVSGYYGRTFESREHNESVPRLVVTYHLPPGWEKWINGQSWTPGISVTVQTSDTLEVVDVISVSMPFTLTEAWNPGSLSLVDFYVEPPAGQITLQEGWLEWSVSAPPEVVTLTKLFHVEPCTWTETILDEMLSVEGNPEPEGRPALIEKTPPILWIDSAYPPDVFPGAPAMFTLFYGNAGGYENDVMIRNDFPPEVAFVSAAPMPDRWDEAEGLWAEWDLGDLAMDGTGSIDVTVAITDGLPPSTTVEVWDVILDHVGVEMDGVATTFHVVEPPPPGWEKWINGEGWYPGLRVTAQTSDTLEVVDVINVSVPFTLTEFWNPDDLTLLGWDEDPPFAVGTIISGNGMLELSVPNPPEMVTLTKLFHVEPCTWVETILDEMLFVEGNPEPEGRPALIEKTPPILWIDSAYPPDVFPGAPAMFTLFYGNAGGYENDVMIRNDFPPEVAFVSAAPMPDRWDEVEGLWAEWYLGDLAMDGTGSIDVTVAIADGLPPSTTVEVWDVILDHVGAEMAGVATTFHIVEPPPPGWEKWINGEGWYPGLRVTAQTSDTLEVVDVINVSVPFTLTEFWNPDDLTLLGWDEDPPFAVGTIISGNGMLELSVPNLPEMVTITKRFHVETGAWAETILDEMLEVEGRPEAELRPIIIEKMQPEMPDLVVTDLWNEDGSICYQVRNVGDATATGGHATVLFVDGDDRASHLVDVDLEPGERWRGCFEYVWACTPLADTVRVEADDENNVAESDEENNAREESWQCDTTSPEIISGSTVLEVTQNSAVISWETDEDSDSVVRYGTTAGFYDLEKTDSVPVIAHTVTLTSLDPSTTYHFVVRSADASGNIVESQDKTFETLAVPDFISPTVSIADPDTCEGIVTIRATASDNIGVERVEFYVNDEHLFTDYSSSSPDWKFEWNTQGYVNGEYVLKVKAYDSSGKFSEYERPASVCNLTDATDPSVAITSPSQNDAVSGTIIVTANMSDDSGLLVAYFYIDGGSPIGVEPFPSNPTSATAQFTWDTTQVANGGHRIGVVVYDKDIKSGLDTVDVTVSNAPLAQPNLIIEKHEVTRYQNGFTVKLVVKNIGKGTASNVVISDLFRPFQATSRTDLTHGPAEYTAGFTASTKWGDCTIESLVDILPNETKTYTYALVPVLIHPSQPAASLGDSVTLWYDGPGGKSHYKELKSLVTKTTDGKMLQDAYWDALKQADYLIVTNPQRLRWHNLARLDDVDAVLADMAQLAVHEFGALGYLYTNSNTTLRNLIKPKGDWAKRMKDGFYKYIGNIGGYLLIVGETEIVPAWDLSVKPAKCSGCPNKVEDSDHNYADTYSGWPPDIVVGRIIGNDASDLRMPIQASIGVYEGWSGYGFDRSDALVVSGTGEGQDKFVTNVNDVEKILKGEKFNVNKLHWKDHSTDTQRLRLFRNGAQNKDVIYFRDHCNPDEWSPALETQHVLQGDPFAIPPIPPVDFVSTKPLAFACCCQAGNYNRGDDENIAEAFLDRGTSVYIGSTEDSPRSINNEGGKNFFTNWGAYKTIGWAFTLTERVLTTSSDTEAWWRYWVAEYNLYGDPKFGAAPPSISPQVAATETQGPLPSIDVVVPDYEVNTVDEVDYIEIPGGMVLLIQDKPQVPYYTVSIDYPIEYKVQGVILTDRSGLVTDTGLNIPVATMEMGSTMGAGKASLMEGEGWFSEEEYNWNILENPDGSTTLTIIMYPFYYNPLTTDVRFYRNYSFDISYTVSPVVITSLATDKDEYEQGDMVMVDIGLNNSEEAQDVIVSALVKRYGTEETMDGLLLSTLDNLSGEASFSPQWDSSGFESGYYYVETTLKDTDGNVLDRRTEMFRLGIFSGEVTSFTATPEHFAIGDSINISLVFSNTGTVNITGTAVIKVQDEAGETVQEFRHAVADLAPANAISFDDVWDTSGTVSGIERGTCNIVGYVLYDSKATDPMIAVVSTESHIYLPVILKSHP